MKTLALALSLLLANTIFSQYNIIKKNGDEIKSKVIEIGTTEIKYKKIESPNGPTYAISKDEVFMVKYQDGTKDVFNSSQTNNNNKQEIEKPKNVEQPKDSEKKNSTPKEEGSYMSKVREIQANDPTIGLYIGNGWLLDPGLSNPVLGFDIRMPRKNIFIRALSIGFRASFKNIAGDGDVYNRSGNTKTLVSKVIYGLGLTAKYHAPIPIKAIQPYIIFNLGAAQFDYENVTAYEGPNYSTGWVGTRSHEIRPYGGAGVGSNFLLGKRFGLFVEFGYFTTSAINTGLVLKL